MYWQKYETPYDVNMNVQIQYILPNRNIEITEKENTLAGDETSFKYKTFYKLQIYSTFICLCIFINSNY